MISLIIELISFKLLFYNFRLRVPTSRFLQPVKIWQDSGTWSAYKLNTFVVFSEKFELFEKTVGHWLGFLMTLSASTATGLV